MALKLKMFFKRAFSRSSSDTKSVRIGVPVPVVLPHGKLPPRTSSGLYSEGVCSLQGKKGEDRMIVGERVFPNVYLYAVIDGHGGAEAAEYLTKALPRVISLLCRERYNQLVSLVETPEQFQLIVKDAFKLCSEEWDGGIQTPSRKQAGAVMTAVLVQDRTCLIAHVGDGRVVAATENAQIELTIEHRAKDPRERERIESKGGQVVDGRVFGRLSPSRAFGDLAVRTLDDGTILDCINPEPELSLFEVDLKGFLVISTDGVNDVISSDGAAHLVRISLSKDSNPEAAASELANLARPRTDDDISVIVLTWE